MSSRNISQNLSNDSSNSSIPHLMQIQNNQESNPYSINFQVTNSNSHINDSLHDDGSNENSMTECFINYHTEEMEGNEDEKINNFDIAFINSNKSK